MKWTQLPEFQKVPPAWQVCPLLTIADFTAGQSPDSDLYNTRGEGLPFLQGNAEFGAIHPIPTVWCTSPKKTCAMGDTLISVRAPVGELNGADRAYGLGRGVGALHPKLVDADYLYHAMHRWRFPLGRAAQGTTFDAVTARHFRQLKALLPSDPLEQAAVARVLTTADSALSAAKAKLTAARRLKAALMQQLFTRGIPGRHTRFRETKIGEIPEDWSLARLGSLATIVSGIALGPEREPRHSSRQYLTVIHVQRERLDLRDVRHLETKPSEIPAMLLEEGDLLLVEGHANSSEIGRAAMATAQVAGFTFQNHIFRVRLLPESEFNRRFLLGVLNSERVRRHWNATCNTSSGLNTINRRGLRRLLIPRPTNPREQDEIAELLEAADANTTACGGEMHALCRLKTSLLQNLLTGQMRVNMEALV